MDFADGDSRGGRLALDAGGEFAEAPPLQIVPTAWTVVFLDS